MATDKGKKIEIKQHDLLGVKPFGSIGPGRSQTETKVVKKLVGKVRAKGSTSKSGETANVGPVSGSISNFVNRK